MSKKLIIHQPTNHYSNRSRYYNIFFENLIKKLSEKNEVIVDRLTGQLTHNHVS
jgi:hypothetical protein